MSLPPDGPGSAPLCARCRPSEDGDTSLVLRVRGLRQTVELLRLGGAIEVLPNVSTLALVRGEPGDAWFSATLPAHGGSRLEQAQALADALATIPGYRIAALATEMGVELDVALLADQPRAEQPQPALSPAGEPEPPRSAIEPIAESIAESPATPIALLPALPHPHDGDATVPPSDGVTPEERPGGAALLSEHLTLVVAPFHSFARLNEFQTALRTLAGVRGARVRRFYKGSLQLAVEYDDPTPLITRLAELPGFRWRLVAENAGRFEIEIDDASAGDDADLRAAG